MSEDDIVEQTKGAYLCLIHPVRRDDTYRQEIAPVIALAPSVPDELVTAMISGASWRERLLGLCMAMSKRPAIFTEAMLQSLRDLLSSPHRRRGAEFGAAHEHFTPAA